MILTVCDHIKADEVRLYGFSDWHLGSAECDEKLIQHDINPDLHNNNVIEKVRYFVNFGSYQGRGMYPKSKAMPGVCLGTPTIRLCGTEKKITIEI